MPRGGLVSVREQPVPLSGSDRDKWPDEPFAATGERVYEQYDVF